MLFLHRPRPSPGWEASKWMGGYALTLNLLEIWAINRWAFVIGWIIFQASVLSMQLIIFYRWNWVKNKKVDLLVKLIDRGTPVRLCCCESQWMGTSVPTVPMGKFYSINLMYSVGPAEHSVHNLFFFHSSVSMFGENCRLLLTGGIGEIKFEL